MLNDREEPTNLARKPRRASVKPLKGPVERLKLGKDYYGRWSGVDVRVSLPGALIVGQAGYAIGGWDVPCRIVRTEKGLVAYAYETQPEPEV